ncbi:MAG: hypothetical protein H6633_18945 [Anaerolineales bacterium]|nr:hypothetical protein [Anaerolineales bacterium]
MNNSITYIPIPRRDIDEMIVEVTHLSANSSGALLDEIHIEQPIFLDFMEYLTDHSLVSNDPSVFSQSEYRYIYLISVVMLKVLIDSRHIFREVTWDDLNATIAATQPLANEIFANPAGLADIVNQLAENHPEPDLLRFLSDACHQRLDDHPDQPPIRAVYRSRAFLILYTILTSVMNNREE